MARSTGVSSSIGTVLADWPHVQQSIVKVLTTPIGSRVMRRDFGSEIPDLIDAKMIQKNVLAIYSAAAMAIAKWEPRFLVTGAAVNRLDAAGRVALTVSGTYYPRGHLGDFSVAEDASTRVVFGG